jgi:hypothetical protein
MVRRTVSLPDHVDDLIRELSVEGESFSAAVVRLIQDAAAAHRGKKRPRYIGMGRSGPRDLGRNYERYLREHVQAR